MASSINWGGVGAVQRTFDTAPAVRLDKEDLAALGNAVGDMMGRRNRAAAVDNDPLLERMKARLAELKNAKASAEASAAMGGEVPTAEYDAEIADLETRIAAREAEVATSRKEYENDPEFVTARREYVSNGDRSHLDNFWRNREAARLRKVQEEQLANEKKKVEAEQEKGKKDEIANGRNKVKLAIINLETAGTDVSARKRAEGELEVALDEFERIGGDPNEFNEKIDAARTILGQELDPAKLDNLVTELGDLKKKKSVTNDEVTALVAKVRPYAESGNEEMAGKARKVLDELDAIKTVEERQEGNDAAYAAEKKKVDDFNRQDEWSREPNGLGTLKNFVYNAKKKIYVPKVKK